MWTTRTNRVLTACDSFKGTLASFKVGEAIEAGYQRFSHEVYSADPRPRFAHCPMSDGGAGLLHSLTYEAGRTCRGATSRTDESATSSSALHLKRVFIPATVPITGPLGTPLTDASAPVSFACDVQKGVIVVEMAEASGLPRIHDPRQRNPLHTTSYGTGEVIRYAMEYLRREAPATAARGVRLYLGIGGSATNDGGIGALQALGLEVFVKAAASQDSTSTARDGEERLERPFRGADLAQVTRVHMSDAMTTMFFGAPSADKQTEAACARITEVYLICDVDNPLVGPRGATYTFGPQKCSPAAVEQNERGSAEVEDTAVGEVRGEAQRRILDQLEAGMTHAAVRIATALWQAVEQRQPAQTSAVAGSHGPEKTAQTHQDALLHAPGGGGAGGMSGFFRFVLGATFLPGADAVAELLNLRVPIGTTATTTAPFTGLLYSGCDVLATGEGSFDSQTVYSHKTVGRLLEMAVEANIYHHRSTAMKGGSQPEKLVKGVLVVCGRCGFPTTDACQSEIEAALIATLLPNLTRAQAEMRTCTPLERAVAEVLRLARANSRNKDSPDSAAGVVKAAIPVICVLPLAPQRFSVKAAMTRPYECVQEAVYRFLKASHAEGTKDGWGAAVGKSLRPQWPSSL